MDGLGLILDGRDVTEEVSVFSAVLDLGLSDLADSATLTFQDSEQTWGEWAPEPGLPCELTWDGVRVFSGAVRSASAANGLYALEVDSSAAGKFRRFSHTCSGSLRDALSAIAAELQLASKFSGDFSADVSGVWLENSTGGEMLRALRELFRFDFVADPARVFFATADALADTSPDYSWAEGPDGDFGFTAPPAAHGVTVTNGQSEATAGDGADRIHADGVPSASLQTIADAITESRNRARASLRLDAGELWLPGSTARLDTVSSPFRGLWLVRSCRLDVSTRRQTIGLDFLRAAD